MNKSWTAVFAAVQLLFILRGLRAGPGWAPLGALVFRAAGALAALARGAASA